MAISVAQPQSSPSVGLYQGDKIEKESRHQEIENVNMAVTPTSDEDPESGKLNKEIIMAYIVRFLWFL